MNNITKNCKLHGLVSNDDIYIKKYKKDGLWKKTIYCKKCIHLKNEKYYAKKRQNPDYVQKKKDRDKNRWIDKKEEITKKRKAPEKLQKRKDAYQARIDYYREKCNTKQKVYRENLHDSYIRKLIQAGNKNIKMVEIPQVMIRFKRTLMQCKKMIKDSIVKKKFRELMENENKQSRTIKKSHNRLT